MYTRPQTQKDPSQLQDALQDLMPPGGLLDVLVEDWHSHFCKAIENITPWHPLYPQAKAAQWYHPELWRMKQEWKMARVSVAVCL